VVVDLAPRLSLRLIDEIERLSRRQVPIAEINRLVGAEAARMGLHRPSYERVRMLVHEARALRRAGRESVSTLALEVAFRSRPHVALYERFVDAPALRLRDITSTAK
jgi:hypothetical protein